MRRLRSLVAALVLPAAVMAQQHLLPHRVAEGGVSIGVPSNGCTRKQDFGLAAVDRGGEGRVRIALRRLRQDPCRARTHTIWLEYSWAELDVEPAREVQTEMVD